MLSEEKVIEPADGKSLQSNRQGRSQGALEVATTYANKANSLLRHLSRDDEAIFQYWVKRCELQFCRADSADFMEKMLKDDGLKTRAQRQIDEELAIIRNQVSFFERYILVKQKTSKILAIWDFLWFFTLMISFGLVPYT